MRLRTGLSDQQIELSRQGKTTFHRLEMVLFDPVGSTVNTLINTVINTISPLDSKDSNMHELLHFLVLVKENNAPIVSMEKVLENSRRSKSK
jgi:hypothetical protein